MCISIKTRTISTRPYFTPKLEKKKNQTYNVQHIKAKMIGVLASRNNLRVKMPDSQLKEK